MILYHLTKREYLPSIFIKGLIPFYKKGISTSTQRYKSQPRVWLTDNPNIPKTQLGTLWNDSDWVLLKVDTKHLSVASHMTTCYTENKPIAGEFVVFDTIPASYISEV
jgi:RNA:NAD 2'-phosphotransferase (TPT1/KptA family)